MNTLNYLIKSAVTCVWLLTLTLSAQAQRFDVNAIDCHLSNNDMTTLNRIGQFEAKFYNVVFNTAINDSLPIRINLYGKKSQYINVQKSALNTTFIDGFYSPGVNRMFLYKGDRYMEIIIHETSHNMLHNNLPYPPIWLNEGIATLFGYLVVKDDGIFYNRQDRYIKMVKDGIYKGNFNLQSYLGYQGPDWYDKDKRDYLYGVAYSLIYFFVKDDIENLQNILVLMQHGYTATDAITKVFGSFEHFDKRFRDFYKPEVGYRL
jgi:hypothetical protein